MKYTSPRKMNKAEIEKVFNCKSATVVEAMQAFMEGKEVLCDWAEVIHCKKNKWFELNVNHIQRGEWFIVNSDTRGGQSYGKE